MKAWTKVNLKEQNRDVELISKALTNYLYGYGPINAICKKYNVSDEDRSVLNQYTANRVAGVLMLYLANDVKRINDIVNRYNVNYGNLEHIAPEIEAYINR